MPQARRAGERRPRALTAGLEQALGDVNVGSRSYPVEYASHSILGGLKLSFDGSDSAGPSTTDSY